MKKAVLLIFSCATLIIVDSAAAKKDALLPGLYRVRDSECPVLRLESFYCRGGPKISVRFTPETCTTEPWPDAVWYDGKDFYFAWLSDYKTEKPREKEWQRLTPSIYWLAKNECPSLTMKNVCTNEIVKDHRPSTKCYKDANFFYWNGATYRFGWVKLARAVGKLETK